MDELITEKAAEYLKIPFASFRTYRQNPDRTSQIAKLVRGLEPRKSNTGHFYLVKDLNAILEELRLNPPRCQYPPCNKPLPPNSRASTKYCSAACQNKNWIRLNGRPKNRATRQASLQTNGYNNLEIPQTDPEHRAHAFDQSKLHTTNNLEIASGKPKPTHKEKQALKEAFTQHPILLDIFTGNDTGIEIT